MADECSLEEIEALLAESDDEETLQDGIEVTTPAIMAENHGDTGTVESSDDDDIDDDELDKLAALIECEEETSQDTNSTAATSSQPTESNSQSSSQSQPRPVEAKAKTEETKVELIEKKAPSERVVDGKHEPTSPRSSSSENKNIKKSSVCTSSEPKLSKPKLSEPKPSEPKESQSKSGPAKETTTPSQPDNTILMKLSDLNAMEEQIRLMKAQLLQQAKQISPELAQTVKSSVESSKEKASTSGRETIPEPKMRLLEEDIFGATSPSPERKQKSKSSHKDIVSSPFVRTAKRTPPRAKLYVPPGDKSTVTVTKKASVSRPETEIDRGDSDSDWEGMDGEKPAGLSKEGKELKKLISDDPKKRVAHTPKHDSAEHEQKKKPYNSTWRNRPEATTSTSAPSFYKNSTYTPQHVKASSTSQPAKSSSAPQTAQSRLEPIFEDEKDVIQDPLTGIRIKDPLVSSSALKSLMSGRKLITLSKLHTKVKTPDLDSDWVTLGVMVSKSEPRKSSKGNQYTIWKLSDLADCDKVVSFFLFGKVFQELWKTCKGTVVGVLNASVMPNTEKQTNNEVAITIDNSKKLLVVGKSKDLGTCRARTKAGNDCSNFVNVTKGEFCTYHVQSAYKKLSNRRSELQAGGAMSAPKSFERKLFGNKSGGSFTYGGQTFTSASLPSNSGPGKAKKSSVSLASLQHHHIKKPNSERNKVNTLKIHDLLPEDRKLLDDQKLKAKEDKHEKFHEALTVPTVGSMNYVKHMMKVEQVKEKEKTKGQGTPIHLVSAKDFLKGTAKELQDRQESQKRRLANKPPSPGTAKSSVPTLGKGLSAQDDILFDFDAPPMMPAVDKKKLKAIAKIQSKGGIQKEDPNALKKVKSPTQTEKVKKRLNESTQEDDEDHEEAPPRKKSKILGDIDLESSEIKDLLKAKSKHDNSLNEIEQERQDRYFEVLEKKEAMEQKMDSVREQKCKAFCCKQCKYRAMSVAQRCKDEKHTIDVSEAVKRFFECTACKFRTVSIERYPVHTCKKCSGSKFSRCSMFKENKGPKLASEELSLRGDEIKYLNSLKN